MSPNQQFILELLDKIHVDKILLLIVALLPSPVGYLLRIFKKKDGV